jgi:hypothetical protein
MDSTWALRTFRPTMGLWQQWEAGLHCHDDPDREERARLFCEANPEAMDA